MKPCRLVSLLLLICLLAVPAARGAGPACATEVEIVALLTEAREAGQRRVEFRCARDLFREVRAGGFARVEVWQLKGGLKNAEVRYSENGDFEFTEIEYAATPWTECADEAAVRAAVLAYGSEGAKDFALIMPPETCAAIHADDRMYAYAAQAGIEDAGLRSAPAAGIIRVSEAVYTDEPYAYVEDEQAFATAIGAFAEAGTTRFLILFDLDLYAALRADPERKRLMQASSQLESYYSAESDKARSIEFREATFSDSPRLLCAEEADIGESIRTMGAAGIADFDLVLPEALFSAVAQDDFARLHALEAEAGLTRARMAYSAATGVLFYTDAAIATDVVKLDTVEEAAEYVNARAADGAEEIDLFCGERLYRRLMDGVTPSARSDSMARIYDLAVQAGISEFSLYYSGVTCVVTIRVDARYPGAKIVDALHRGETDALTPRETETWRAAEALAAEAAADTPRETALRVHNLLCVRITYLDDPAAEEDDTAVGALLNGEANCDGYADAFYLAGTLAGLSVRCQHGDSYDARDAAAAGASVTHMWNLVELDGTWRMVDVTWDDDPDGWAYTWFDLGYDRASRTHFWNEEMSVPLRPDTDLSQRPENEFAALGLDDALAAVDAAASARLADYCIVFDREIPLGTEREVLDAVSRRVSQAFTYAWNDRMRALTVAGASY